MSIELDIDALEATKPSRLAYRRFKEALFERRLEAGAIVSQSDLVLLTGVPISALREALQILEAEGLLRILPRSGIQIAKPDLALVRNAFQLRGILEVPAHRHMAEAMPKARLLEMDAEHAAFLERTAGREITPEISRSFSTFDFAFHQEAVCSLRNPLLAQTWERTFDRIRLIRLDHLNMLSTAAIARTVQEHRAIIAACLARDPVAAGAALELHFARALERALGMR